MKHTRKSKTTPGETSISLEELRLRKGLTNWERVDRTTDEEIRQQIADDPDTAPELDEHWAANAIVMRPARKQAISLRVDPDVLDWYRAQGEGYQSRMNAVLRAFMKHVAEQKVSPAEPAKRTKPR